MGKPRVQLNAGGLPLVGRLYGDRNSGPMRPAVLFIRGWSPYLPQTYMDLHARLCARNLGLVCFSAQYRGMGSPGNPYRQTRAAFLRDVLAAYDFLAGLECVDSRKIYIVGESLGAYMACLLSARRPVAGMLLRAPADFPNDGFDIDARMNRVIKRTMGWRRSTHPIEDSYALEAIHGFAGDVLIVESERDALIPHRTVENYLRALGSAEHIVMKNAGHRLVSPIRQREFHRIVQDWLRSQLEVQPY